MASERPSVCVVSPSLNGGIRRLFDMVFDQPDTGELRLSWFVSSSGKTNDLVLFPLRLGKLFWLALTYRHALYHFNLASKGSTLRKVLYGLILRALGQRYVVHLHGGGFRVFYFGLPPALKKRVRNFLLDAARIIVLGRVWRDFMVDEVGVPAARVVVLPNAVAGPASDPVDRPSRPHILFLGRLNAQKGVPELLEALASPAMANLDWTATIAGDGEVETYRKRAAELGLAGRVDLPGWVDGEQVEALLHKSTILVLPSHVENLPLSMLEGMGYGLCPVVTPVGAVEDVIRDGENGLLVPVGDAKALANALARLCRDDALRQRLASQARADFLAHYDIRNYRARLEAIYLDVIDGRRAGSQGPGRSAT